MDFTFSDEQDALRAAVREVLADQRTSGLLRRSLDGDATATGEAWRSAVELGWPALLVPEDAGGLGLGLVDAVVVLEETGRVTWPAPFLASSVCATTAAIAFGADELLTDLASGASTGTVALEELGHGDPVARVRTRATRRGGRWLLDGLKPLVLAGADADWVIVAAHTQEGLGAFLIRAPSMEPVATLDPTRPAARLELDATPAEPIGERPDGTATWRHVADVMAVALAAELVGVGDEALAATIAYTGDRVQFDVPLSSHQVVQHKLVDMLHRLELGRVGVHHAAWAIDTGDTSTSSTSSSAAIAKSAMGEAAVAITADAIQLHGAVGFTWDADLHLLFKRAKQNDVLAGSQSWQRQRIADEVIALG